MIRLPTSACFILTLALTQSPTALNAQSVNWRVGVGAASSSKSDIYASRSGLSGAIGLSLGDRAFVTAEATSWLSLGSAGTARACAIGSRRCDTRFMSGTAAIGLESARIRLGDRLYLLGVIDALVGKLRGKELYRDALTGAQTEVVPPAISGPVFRATVGAGVRLHSRWPTEVRVGRTGEGMAGPATQLSLSLRSLESARR